MKKTISLIAALLLVLAVLPVSALPRIEAPVRTAPVFTADTVTASEDQDVEVSLQLEGSYDANVLTVFIDFDNTKLSVVSITLGAVAQEFQNNDGYCVNNVHARPDGTELIANIESHVGVTCIVPEETVSVNGTVFTVKFHTAEGLQTGDSVPLNVDVQVFTNLDMDSVSHPIEHETSAGAVNIDNHETFTITWKNWDGEVLKTEEVEHDQIPVYTGDDPERPADDQYTYVFDGWTPSIVPATENATYTAKFRTVTNFYQITWKNWDGEVLKTDTLAYGATPEYTGETPTKPKDAENTYEFSGWTPEIQAVTGNAEYTAVFNPHLRSYTVTWKNWDGEVLKTDTVEYGATPEYTGETPTKPEDAQNTYEFSGWTPEIQTVTGNAEYTAVFSAVPKTFTVTFVDGITGGTIATVTVEYGKDATPPEAPEHGGYIFIGWEGSFENVTADVTVTAKYGMLGDVDGNGKVEATDALLALRMAMSIIETPDNILIIDVDGNGRVEATDALLILRFAMGIITSFN
ncbi:MAG: InlB B-repeat-containing protein [Clostridiales bacterium]|nr:InlB B-repeat-containing protein [Clostridiales bacterium]